jgi:hypothetical protein
LDVRLTDRCAETEGDQKMKRDRIAQVVERWCGQRPARGSDKLRELWEQHGPSGAPVDDEGVERLIQGLDQEFHRHGLRPVDVLELTFDGLVDAVPDSVAGEAVAFTLAARRLATSNRDTVAPVVVTLSDDSIERLATRITELVRTAASSRRRSASTTGRSSRQKRAEPSAKRSSKAGRRKVR